MTVTITEKAAPIRPPLLTDNDPAPYTLLNEGGKTRCLIVSDHAGNIVPEKLDNLGLSPDDLQKHIAWDIGVRHITERLSEIMDAPAIFGNISRLVVDLNRRLDHPTAFITNGEGTPVPGNATMSGEDRKLRIDEIYDPYHAKIDSMVKGWIESGDIPIIVSLHSFTKNFYKQVRPWEIGFLWVQDGRLPKACIEFFRGEGFCVGDNEPYDARVLRGTTVNRHADDNGLPNVLVEFRNDLIDTHEKGETWATLMAECLQGAMKDESLFTLYEGPKTGHDPEREISYFDELIAKAKSGG